MIRSKPMQCTCEWQRRRQPQQQFNHKSNATLFSVSRKSVFKWTKKHFVIVIVCWRLLFSSSQFFLSFSLVLVSVIVVVGFSNHFIFRSFDGSFVQTFVRLSIWLFIWWHLKFVVGLCTLIQFQWCVCMCVVHSLSLSLAQISHSLVSLSQMKAISLCLPVCLSVSSHLFITRNRPLFIFHTISFYLYLCLSAFSVRSFIYIYMHTRVSLLNLHVFSVFCDSPK